MPLTAAEILGEIALVLVYLCTCVLVLVYLPSTWHFARLGHGENLEQMKL